jgi:hypothetical protein
MAEPTISFGNIVALYGTYFLAQSYGYAHGRKQNATIEVKEAILFGAQHLYHIAKPTGSVAWPLTPFLCAGLLLFVTYSPYIEGPACLLNCAYAALIVASVIGIGAVTYHGTKWGKRTYNLLSRVRGRFQIFYLLVYIVSVIVVGPILARWCPPISLHQKSAVFREMFAHGITGWLFFVAYVGSRFDGEIDLARGCPLDLQKPTG